MSDQNYKTEWLQQLRSLDNNPEFVSMLDDIEEFGWGAMLINAKRQSESFAYTVGLYDTMKFPELIVVGLASKVGHSALQYAIDEMKAGKDLTQGTFRDIVGDVEVVFRPVSQRWFRHVMCRADWYYGYGETAIPALQLIYPDLDGKFQWEEGFNDYFLQPMLALEPEPGTAESEFWAVNDPESSLSDWKFQDDPHTTAYLSTTVHNEEEEVTYVSHDKDGDWQFLGDKMSEGGGPVIVCLHHPIDIDSTLAELHDLPPGWYAERDKPGEPWRRAEHPGHPDEDEEEAQD